VFALLVAPAAAAQTLTARPARGLVLSVTFSLLVMWLGLAFAYFSIYPLGFFVTSFGFAVYLLAKLARGLAGGGLTRGGLQERREHAANPNPSTAAVG
jgi:zinc/manganese transport system permease protein